uniref:Uncharacterized protein n=1 Tax=Aegilops tauschii TaxID=37682 RepID=R7W274_AEGTA
MGSIMNPENRGQETTGPVYAPTPLRTTWSVDLGNGLNGTFVHSNINGTTRLLVPEVRSAAAPATTSPTAPPTTGSPTAPASQDQYEQSAIDLITLLYSCSTAVAKGDKELVNVGLEMICSGLASDDVGWPIHRLASSFADALALRMVQPWQGVCRALQLQKTTPAPATAAACRHFVEMCLFLRLTRTTANYGIIDATRTERNVVLHEDEFLSVTGALLAREAESLHIGFHFHPVKLQINQLLSIEPLGVRSGETLVIVSTLQLHRLLADEFVEVAARPHDRKGKAQAHATMMRADALLRDLAKLSPKLMVVTEPEVNHNGEFTARVENALNYYGALFDALEESVPTRGSAMERADVERCLLLQEIRDIVPYDGAQRRERHERMGSGRDG